MRININGRLVEKDSTSIICSSLHNLTCKILLPNIEIWIFLGLISSVNYRLFSMCSKCWVCCVSYAQHQEYKVRWTQHLPSKKEISASSLILLHLTYIVTKCN